MHSEHDHLYSDHDFLIMRIITITPIRGLGYGRARANFGRSDLQLGIALNHLLGSHPNF